MSENWQSDLKGLGEAFAPIIKVFADYLAPGATYLQSIADASATRRAAKADVEALHVREQGNPSGRVISAPLHRAFARVAAREEVRQINLECILEQTAKQLPRDASPGVLSPQRVRDLLDRAQDLSEPDFQTLWAGILAQEILAPGTWLLRELDEVRKIDRTELDVLIKARSGACTLRGNCPDELGLPNLVRSRHGPTTILAATEEAKLAGLGAWNPDPSAGNCRVDAESPMVMIFHGRSFGLYSENSLHFYLRRFAPLWLRILSVVPCAPNDAHLESYLHSLRESKVMVREIDA